VLALDDFDLLDRLSMRWLRAVASDASVRLLVTARGTVDRLWSTNGRGRLAVVSLDDLSEQSVAGLVRATSPRIGADELHRIAMSAGGNPALALALAASEDGRAGEALLASVPAGWGNGTRAVLGGLPPRTRALVEALATVGDTNTAMMLLGGEQRIGRRALEDAQERGIVCPDGKGFACPRARLTAYHEIAPARAREWNRRAAAVLQDPVLALLYRGFAVDGPCEALARRLECVASGAPKLLAARLLSRSLALTALTSERERWRRQVALAVNMAQAGAVLPARAALETVIQDAPRGPWLSRALVERARLGDLTGPLRVRMLGEALRNGGDDPSARGVVLEALALELAFVDGDLAGAAGTARAAAAIARPQPNSSVDASVALIDMVRGQLRDSQRRAKRAALPEQPRQVQNVRRSAIVDPTDPHRVAAFAALWQGQPAVARTRLAALARNAFVAHAPLAQMRALIGLAEAELRLGRLPDAERRVDTAARLAVDASDLSMLSRLSALRQLIDAHRGFASYDRPWRWWEPERGQPAWTGDAWAQIWGLWATGLVELAAARPRTAAVALMEACRRLERAGIEHPGVHPLAPDAVAALTGAGREQEAADVTERLAAQATRATGRWAAVATMRCRALLRLRREDPRVAASELEEARRILRNMGLRLEAARVGLELARALRRTGVRSAALRMLAESERTFASVGASAWQERCSEERDRLGGQRVGDRDTLTPCELQVARLAAAGHSNREIAAELCVGLETVRWQLKTAYRKLGLHSRAQLARSAITVNMGGARVEATR
jgi:DNA-binding CsgD family transcriptional regulator